MEDILTTAKAWDDQFQEMEGVELLKHPNFVIPEFDDQIQGSGDSFVRGAAGSGIITSAMTWLLDGHEESDVVDPNWDSMAYMKEHSLFGPLLERAQVEGSPYDQAFIKEATASQNESQFQRAVQIYQRDLATQEAMNENPVASALGMVLGIAPDVAVSMLAPAMGPAGITAAVGRFTGAGFAARTMASARAVGAARIGGYGAAEGLLSAAAEDLNRTMLTDDYVWYTVIGFGVGGILGGAFPKAIGRVGHDSSKWRSGEVKLVPREDAQAAGRAQSEVVDGGDAGAMRAPNDAEKVVDFEINATALGATGVINRKFLKTVGTGRWLLSPKTVVTQYLEIAKRLKGTPAGEAMSRVANISGRIFSPNVVTASNELGDARMMNATDILNDIDANRTDRLMDTDQANKDIRKLLAEHYTLGAKASSNSAFVEKTIGDSVAKAMPAKDDVWRLADQKAYMDRLNAERAVQAPTTDAVATPLPPVSKETVFASVPKMNNIPEELKDQVWGMVADIARKDNEFYAGIEARMVKAEMLKEGESIDNYRGQLWDADRVDSNRDRHMNFLYRILDKEPDQAWVKENWVRLDKDADGKVITDPDGNPTKSEFWEEGETWETAYARDPKTAQTILEDWGHNLALDKITWLKGREDGFRNVLEDAQVEDIAGLETKFSGQLDKVALHIEKAEFKLERLRKQNSPQPGTAAHRRGTGALFSPQMDETKALIARHQVRQGQILEHMKRLSDAFDNLDELTRLQKKHRTPNRPASKSAKKMAGDIRRTTAKVADAEASRTIHEIITEIHEGMASGANARLTDLPMDRNRAGKSRTLRRQLNLGDEQFSEDAAFFMPSSSEKKMLQYTHTVGRTLSMKEAMTPYIRKYRPDYKSDGPQGDIDVLFAIMSEEFAKARRLTTDPKVLKMLGREQKKSREFVKNQMESWGNIGQNDVRTNGWMEVMLNGTSMASLGTVVVTQMTDIPTALLSSLKGGGPRFIKNLTSPARQKRIAADLAEIKADSHMMYSAARGLNAYDTMRWEKLTDTGDSFDPIADVVGGADTGALGLARAGSREAGKIQSRVSLAPTWNSWVQKSFGHSFMESMNDSLHNYSKLHASEKEHLARLGIGQSQVDRMVKLLDDPKMSMHLGPDGGLKVPKRDMWPEDLYGDYLGTLRRAQNEALIAPEIGDMPFIIKKHPILRLVYQFSSFSFAWSGQVLRKAIQRGVLHPDQYNDHAVALTGVAFGFMVMYLKNTLIYDKTHDEVLNKPTPDLIWDIMSRTPYVTGMGNSLIESAFTLAGEPINNMLGANVLPQTGNYFKWNQGLAGGLGPTFGLANSAYKNMASGDFEKSLARSLAAAPIANTILLKPLINMYKDD